MKFLKSIDYLDVMVTVIAFTVMWWVLFGGYGGKDRCKSGEVSIDRVCIDVRKGWSRVRSHIEAVSGESCK